MGLASRREKIEKLVSKLLKEAKKSRLNKNPFEEPAAPMSLEESLRSLLIQAGDNYDKRAETLLDTIHDHGEKKSHDD